MTCDVNNVDCNHNSQHWHLNNYFGISGYFCSYHYNMVSHDAYGQPRNKDAYEKMLTIRGEYIKQTKR